MLVVTKKVGDKICIGDAVVSIAKVRGKYVTLQIEAPEDIRIEK